ncbi:hypothetical protein A9G28_11550 [Gilliamella sp. Fer1-1]|jgi:uncharacterized protein YdaT|uniref:hypothetical protein n=1 Tax=unclassified Gilliamella TaxID=2685620 RepID=UPI00080E70EF|nr:hypothetical protein [Gilliamella apicola]OCG34302.1 hypothetical protein A9G29_03540 [Gilliamella apicola]OCG45934.1 hypothetical protein A9G28_11550 [Gilliamella apicola]OCG57698.1 hypothetical protein A9G40_12265 [Gilliamella apicola]OCG62063.1 hypothetical protein A9G30_09795 [Gilliamella apicola]OCG71645.1 hypothetical protein A9G41_02275 [Gilliamella apicola]
MKKLSLVILLILCPMLSFAKGPDCHTRALDKAKEWLKNSNIVEIENLNQSKLRITLLASEQKSKDLYTQIYHFVFYDNKNKAYEVITKSEASNKDCSIGEVDSYLVSKRQIDYFD